MQNIAPLPGPPMITRQFATDLPSKHNGVNAAAVMLKPRDQRSMVAAAAIASRLWL